MEFAEFISAHEGDDLGRLALARDRYAGQVDDFDLALTTLEVRRKLRDKVPQWYAVPSLHYPLRVSGEQCSSAETARYKAAVARAACDAGRVLADGAFSPGLAPVGGDAGYAKMAQNALLASPERLELRKNGPKCVTGVSCRLADLTGGLGVDSWAFSQLFDEVLYNEMRPELADAARYNFQELGLSNVLVRNGALVPQVFPVIPSEASVSPEANVSQILGDFRPDIVFLDPARRAVDGRKVFRLEDCQPDVLQLLPELLAACPRLLLKLSPMADISLVCKQLGCVKEVHVVAADGECKELLLLLEIDYDGPVFLIVYENGAILRLNDVGLGLKISGGPDPTIMDQRPMEGNNVGLGPGPKMRPGPKQGETWPKEDGEQHPLWLFEPGKALLKAGAFDLPCRYGLQKLGQHTHLYVDATVPDELKPFGKCFQILEMAPLNKRSIKEIGKKYPQAEVTARNIPMTSEQLRAKLGVRSGGDVHIFGIRVDADQSNQLVVVRRMEY